MAKQQKRQEDVGKLLGFLSQQAEPDEFVLACQAALASVGWDMSESQILEAIKQRGGGREEFAKAVTERTGIQITVTATPAPTPAEPEVDTHRLELELEQDEIGERIANGVASPEDYVRMGQVMAELAGMPAPSITKPKGPEMEMPALEAGKMLGDVTAAGVVYWRTEKDAFAFAKFGGFHRDSKTTNLAHGRIGDSYVRFYASGQRTDLSRDGTWEKIAHRVVSDVRDGGYKAFESVRSWGPTDSRKTKVDGQDEGGTFTVYQFVGDDYAGVTEAHEIAFDLKNRRIIVTDNTRPFSYEPPPESVEDLEIPF